MATPWSDFVGRSTFYVRYQTAELDKQMARMEQPSDGKLMRLAEGCQPKGVQCIETSHTITPQGSEQFRI